MRLLFSLADLRTFALLVLGLSLVGGSKALGLAAPFALKSTADALAAKDKAGLLLLGKFTLLKGGSQVLNNSKNVVLSWISRPLGRKLAERLYSHTLEQELEFHAMRRTGSLLRRLDRSSRAVDTLLRAVLFTFVPVCCELCVVAGLLRRQGLGIVMVVLMAFVSYWIFTMAVSLGWVTRARRRMNIWDNVQSSRATEALLNVEQVKLFNAKEREERAFSDAQAGLRLASQSSDTAAAFLSGGQQVITTTGMGVALSLVAQRVCRGAASVGDVFMVQSLITQLWNPLQFLGFYIREARQAFVDLDDARALLSKQPRLRDPPQPVALPPAGGNVPVLELRGASFRYGDGPLVLNDVSLAIPAGARVAIVGASGGGKSTIARLAPRLGDPCAGQVLFNGVDVRDVSTSELRERVAMVSQDVIVFNETIRYNLEYACQNVDADRLEAALRTSRMDAVVAALPRGLDTPAGERGLQLSGGERQRLALARALLRSPELLVLDEATSALDAEAEQLIVQALTELDRDQAVLAITHRLAVAEAADEVIVLEGGRVAERGPPAELAARGGIYARLRDWGVVEDFSTGEPLEVPGVVGDLSTGEPLKGP